MIGDTYAGYGTFRQFAARASDDAARIAAARRIWGRAREASGTPVAAYLAGRGITIAPPESVRSQGSSCPCIGHSLFLGFGSGGVTGAVPSERRRGRHRTSIPKPGT